MFHLLLVSVQRGEVECCIALDYLLNRSPWELYMFIFRFLLSIAYTRCFLMLGISYFLHIIFTFVHLCAWWCDVDLTLTCPVTVEYVTPTEKNSVMVVFEKVINFSSRELLLLFSKHTKCTILMHNLNTTSIMQFFVQH